MVRLNKYLSEAGVCSRREADRLILSGQVTVDGQRAVPGMQVTDSQEVRVGKKVIRRKEEKVILAFYKPAGIVCTEERRERNSTARFLNYSVRVTYAGRLDKDSEGLDAVTRPCRAEAVGKFTFRIVLTQGLNRQIRRMCQAFGYQVKKLVRIRIMNIRLDDLKPGEYRPLTAQEARELYEQTETRTDEGIS